MKHSMSLTNLKCSEIHSPVLFSLFQTLMQRECSSPETTRPMFTDTSYIDNFQRNYPGSEMPISLLHCLYCLSRASGSMTIRMNYILRLILVDHGGRTNS